MKSILPNLAKFFFGSTVNLILNIITLLGFVTLFMTDKDEALVALMAFCIFLIMLLGRFYWVTSKLINKKYEDGHEKLTTHVRYMTRDGKSILFELQKYIQCKQVIMNQYEHTYDWTGSNNPIISSGTMEFKKVVDNPDGSKRAIFKCNVPAFFNSVFLANIKMDIDDSDRKSKTHVEHKVTAPMQMIEFKIELYYKRGNVSDARIKRRAINALSTVAYEDLGVVPFEKKGFSYHHVLYNPEPGYKYRIEWER